MSSAPSVTWASIIDQYSPLSHKGPVGDGRNALQPRDLPTWIPRESIRRLAAYRTLARYWTNTAREILRDATELQKAGHREYGDIALVVSRIRSGILGEQFGPSVDGANDDLDGGPILPDPPTDPGPEASEVERRIFAVRNARYLEAVDAAVTEWEQRISDQPWLRKIEDELKAWCDRELFAPKAVELEEDAVALGDGVYVLWPRIDDWPELEVYEPDAYHPHLHVTNRGFPNTIDLSWEEEWPKDPRDPNGAKETFVRRLRWTLVDIASQRVVEAPEGLAWGQLLEGETITMDGSVSRPVPWSDEPTTVTCLHSNGLWSLDKLSDSGIADLSDGAAREFTETDLGCDFIPVIHVPNTPASRTHFGESSISPVAQILDDLAQSDSDLNEVSRLVAGPVMWFSGTQVDPNMSITPLATFGLGPEGKAGFFDLSGGLANLTAAGDRLHDRFLMNIRVPGSLVGKVDSAEAASGIAMLIETAPFGQVIQTSRMARDPKYGLLYKFSVRFAMLSKVLEPGEIPTIRMAWGPYLPLDSGAVVDKTIAAYGAKVIDLSTAVTALAEAGAFPIDDVARVVTSIEQSDFEGAKALADATGSEQPAADRLGITLPDKPAPPRIDLPPPPGQNQPPGEQP